MSALKEQVVQKYFESMAAALSPKVFNPEDLGYLLVIVQELWKENKALKRRIQEIVDHYQLY
jgi:hypothetical protein